jgi:acyl carrier protein
MTATLTPEQIETKIYASLVEFGADPDAVSHEARWEVLRIDSLDLVELAQVVEDEFGVQISGEDMKNLPTVGSVVDLVVSRSAP